MPCRKEWVNVDINSGILLTGIGVGNKFQNKRIRSHIDSETVISFSWFIVFYYVNYPSHELLDDIKQRQEILWA